MTTAPRLRYHRGMSTVVQNRGGRPVIQFDSVTWARIDDCARLGLNVHQCADYIGINEETLIATEGFSERWKRLKEGGHHRIAERLHQVALGEVKTDMPSAATAMYLAKVRLGWIERDTSREAALLAQAAAALATVMAVAGAIQRSPAPVVVEGQVVADALPPADALLALLPGDEAGPGQPAAP